MPKSARQVLSVWLDSYCELTTPGEQADSIISALESAGYVIVAARPPAASPGVRDVERAYAVSRTED